VTGFTLALSTASPALSLALFNGDVLVAHDHRVIGRGHAEALVPAIAALLAEHRAAEIGSIIVDTGPGSFTGIRIGIAAARALGLAWGVPVTGLEGGSLVAARAFALRPGLGGVTVLLDAGRGQVLRQRIDADFSASSIETINPAQLEIASDEPIAGAAAPAGRGDLIHDGQPDAAFALRVNRAQRELAPRALYVRPPDAVLPL